MYLNYQNFHIELLKATKTLKVFLFNANEMLIECLKTLHSKKQ